MISFLFGKICRNIYNRNIFCVVKNINVEWRQDTMGKDVHLINIYLKIHNKQTLTVDDLRYLAKYSPECFEKTCRNVVYNIPNSKSILESNVSNVIKSANLKPSFEEPENLKAMEKQHAEEILEKIKQMEADEFPIPDIEADDVKNLLGNLYMEMLFPHNDKTNSLYVNNDENISRFDRKA